MKDLEEKFLEIERRVRALAAENHAQKARIRELEQELVQTRHDAQKSVRFHDKQLHLRERIEKVLRDLEAAEIKKS